MAENSTNLRNKGVFYDYSDDEEDERCDFYVALTKLSLGPRKKFIVLCLGGLLCQRVFKYDLSEIPRSRSADAEYGNTLVYKRPYCEEFMKFCFERFEVGIWSSANEWNVNRALDCIMKGLQSKLFIAWDKDECTNSRSMSLENKNKPLFLKEFKKLQKFSAKISASNTLLIDANPYKALLNPPHTAIFPTAYKADQVDDDSLGPGGDLRVYLDGLAAADDVPSYVKEHPFGQPAISPEHSDWGFYRTIIRRFQKE